MRSAMTRWVGHPHRNARVLIRRGPQNGVKQYRDRLRIIAALLHHLREEPDERPD